MSRQSILFTHDNKSFSLEPDVISVDNNTLDIIKDKTADGDKKNNNIKKSKRFLIDGRLHSLSETASSKSQQDAKFDKGVFII